MMNISRKKKVAIFVMAVLILIYYIVFTFVPSQAERNLNGVLPHLPYPISEKTQAFYKQLLVADLHSDSLLWNRNLLERAHQGHVDIPRLREGNVGIQIFSAVTKSPKGHNIDSTEDHGDKLTALALVQQWPMQTWGSLYQRALYQASRLDELTKNAPKELRLVKTRGELSSSLLERAQSSNQNRGPIIAVLSLEGGHAFEGKLENIDGLYAAGYRMVGLTHFFDNELSGSLHGISKSGLTEFGRQAVKRMESLGIIIDLAHASPQTVEEVFEISSKPVVVSHTGLKGHCNTARNISDDLMKRIAERGGIIGIGYWESAVCDPTPRGIVSAIKYGVDLLGVNNISLGSDFDGAVSTPFDTSELAVLVEEMLRTGFTDSQIRQVMGENVKRFLLENLPDS